MKPINVYQLPSYKLVFTTPDFEQYIYGISSVLGRSIIKRIEEYQVEYNTSCQIWCYTSAPSWRYRTIRDDILKELQSSPQNRSLINRLLRK